MAIKKYKLSIYEINEDKDLKFLKFMATNYIPRIGETIELIIRDEFGKPVRGIQYIIKNVLYPCLETDTKNEIAHFDNDEIILHVELEIDEPIFGNYITC